MDTLTVRTLNVTASPNERLAVVPALHLRAVLRDHWSVCLTCSRPPYAPCLPVAVLDRAVRDAEGRA